MKAGTPSRAIRKPLVSPGTSETANAARIPSTNAASGPNSGISACIIRAQITAASPMVKPTDRSMPPEMITSVWPSASSRGATANSVML